MSGSAKIKSASIGKDRESGTSDLSRELQTVTFAKQKHMDEIAFWRYDAIKML